MADEAKAPEPAKPAEPAAAPGAPAAGGPPTKMIMMGCGGIAAVGLFIVLIWGLLSLFSCGGLSVPGTGADLKTPESAAKSFMTFMWERELIQQEEQYNRASKDLEQMRALLPWMADKSAAEKDIKRREAWVEAYKKHRSELRKFTVDVVEVKDADGVKAVKIKAVGKRLEPEGTEGDKWKLSDNTDGETVYLTQIEGKWKVKKE